MTLGRAMTEQAADAATDTACRILRLPTVRARFAETAGKAERDQLSYRGFLAELFMAECEDRDHRRAERAAARRRVPPRSLTGASRAKSRAA